MSLRLTTIGLLMSLYLLTPSLSAQIMVRETIGHNDIKLWLGFQYQHAFSKSFQLQVNLQTRLEQQLTLLDKNLAELEFSYQHPKHKILKHFVFGAGFRFLGINDIRGKKQGHKLGYRLYGLISFQEKWKRLELGYRLMYQNQQILPRYFEEDDDWKQEQSLRNRVTVGYDFKKWKLDPELRAELFYPLEQDPIKGFSGLRLGIGTKYKFNKHHTLKFRFLYEQSLGLEYVRHDYIFVLIYQYKTKYKKRKKKKKDAMAVPS